MVDYKAFMLPLTKGQTEKAYREIKKGSPFSLRISGRSIGSSGSVPMMLTDQQIKKFNKMKGKGQGVVLNISKTQSESMRRDKGVEGGGFLNLLGKVWDSTNLLRKGVNATIRDPLYKAVHGKKPPKKWAVSDKIFGSSLENVPEGSGLFDDYIKTTADILKIAKKGGRKMTNVVTDDMKPSKRKTIGRAKKKALGQGMWTQASPQS